MKALAIDLFCGLGGWTSGLLAEDYYVVGFDIERHVYGEHHYPAQLVLQDVLTLHGSQFKDAALIVASPPCQEFSYMAMPWSRAKQIQRALRGNGEFPEGYAGSRTVAELTALFDACFRIQREACEAAGHHIPMVVENVRGAQEWVGKARWNFGSYYLWGDVPALMPPIFRGSARLKTHNGEQWNINRKNYTGTQGWRDDGLKTPGFRFDGSGKSFQSEAVKVTGLDWSGYGKPGYKAKGFNVTAAQRVRAEEAGSKNDGSGWRPNGTLASNNRMVPDRVDGIKCGGDWFNSEQPSISRLTSSKSDSRKFASAMIAKIPEPLSRYIASVYRP